VNVTTYPSVSDYTLALQNPATAFADASLRTATFTQGMLGPYGIPGTSAVVFHATIEGQEYALRCYTRRDASTPERYAALDSFVSGNGLSGRVGIVTWYKDQIQLKGARWPVLKMGWIEGQQLNEYAGYLADTGNSNALRTLAERWLGLVEELQQAGFAHGDLQHGNILVDQESQLRLVDFDSVWIPPLQGQAAPTETGHPSYQPQGGTAKSRWGPHMDTFSGLVIYLALTALAKDPGLWPRFNNGDNLLFEREDFDPALDRDIWKQLAALGDTEVSALARKLRDCCAPDWVASRTLRDTLKTTWWEQVGRPDKPVAPSPKPAPGTSAAATGPFTVSAGGTVSVPRQAPPAGSLPPPPSTPYQSKVTPQSAGTPSGATGQDGAEAGGWPWAAAGEPAEPASTAAKPAGTPAQVTPKQPAKSGGGRNALGGLLVIAAVIVFFVLAFRHQAVEGAIWGALLFICGAGVAGSRPKNPPGA
jgi:eukaryotic-like serine/threonine-protein kinase